MSEKCISNHLDINMTSDGRYSVFSQVTKKTYILGKTEYSILINLDGINSSEDLCRLNHTYSKEKVDRLIERFETLGLIKGSEKKQKQNLLRLRYGVINPNKFINNNSPVIKIAANAIVWCSFVLFMIGLSIVILYREIILLELTESLKRPSTLVVIPVFIMVLLLHEFGHVLMARYYNVNVPEMGIVLYFFMPGAYVNLTGVGLLKSRRKRILIYLGGIFVNAGLAGLSLILFRLTGISAKWFFLWFAFENVIYIIVNLFIYLKMDGYLVLQELLDERNLLGSAVKCLTSEVTKKMPFSKKEIPYNINSVFNEQETSEYFFHNAVLKSYSLCVLIFIPVIIVSIILSQF